MVPKKGESKGGRPLGTRFVVQAEQMIFGELGDGVLFALGVEEFDTCHEGRGKLDDGADLTAHKAVIRCVLKKSDKAEEFKIQGGAYPCLIMEVAHES
jgi:hypothetical protein